MRSLRCSRIYREGEAWPDITADSLDPLVHAQQIQLVVLRGSAVKGISEKALYRDPTTAMKGLPSFCMLCKGLRGTVQIKTCCPFEVRIFEIAKSVKG